MTNFIEKNSPPSTYWRAILIIGRNTTSYKFSWQKTLLENHKNKSSIKIEDIALPFALNICEHLKNNKKQHTGISNSFLVDCKKYNKNQINSEQLKNSSIKNGFNYVLDAFHNVAGGVIPIFYEIVKKEKRIVLTDNFFKLLDTSDVNNFNFEVQSRWQVWETGITEGINPRLLDFSVDTNNEILVYRNNKNRRTSVTSLKPFLNLYQKGICFYCRTNIRIEKGFENSCEVDHYFPHKLKDFGIYNVDQIWNLVLSCVNCNRGKSLNIPVKEYIYDLDKRNNWYIESHRSIGPHIMKQTAYTRSLRKSYLNKFDEDAISYIPFRWKPNDFFGKKL